MVDRPFGLVFLIILGQLISGCMSDEGMDWPDRVDSECEFEFENLSCSVREEGLNVQQICHERFNYPAEISLVNELCSVDKYRYEE